ncbi:MAG: hypothetical protein A2W31_14070 [Planctomycetes bacterium RBG_16_64_10]|nr:MAG: hypothetical protein A2W31_14070 [Planctomycetes bacterium RBG_16_64_10]
MELVRIESSMALRSAAAAWDDLWQRSDVALPLARAKLLAQWLEHFGRSARFVALTVRCGTRWLAALPLVEVRVAGCRPAGRMATSAWSSSGELLLDPTTAVEEVLDCLVAGLSELPWPVLWLDCVRGETPRWVALRAALARAGLVANYRTQCHLGQIATDQDWPTYRAGWSRGHRRSIRRSARRLQAAGQVTWQVFRDGPPAAVDGLLVRGFELEDRGWKGRAGTSVLRSPGILGFYLRQARQLAEWGHLELLFLELDGQPIAFEYGYSAKGVYFSHKVAYDEAYARFGPGQMLVYHQVARCHADPTRQLIDSMGVLCPAMAKWTTHTTPMGRLVVGVDGALGRLLVQGYAAFHGRFKRVARSAAR